MTNWYAVPNKPECATNRARFSSTSSVPRRFTPSLLDMTYEHVHAFTWSSPEGWAFSRSLRRVGGLDEANMQAVVAGERFEPEGLVELEAELATPTRRSARRQPVRRAADLAVALRACRDASRRRERV